MFPVLLVAGVLLNINGLLLPILEPDGALYATISKRMVLSGDWINIWADGHDWLDKPHLPFWLCALGMKVFGVTSFGYKFPAFVFWLIGTFYTYKLASVLYNGLTAKVTVIIYIFSLHGLLNSFDVRAEPFLTAFSIAAIYHFYKAYISDRWLHVVLAAFMAACAVMSKGIFVLITIGAGFVIYWMVSKQWKQFTNLKWWAMVVLILLFITPELYCLYTQFDSHPEKVIFNRTNVSGIKFFFWDSQFGRFFNSGPIKGNGDPFFFLHTTLWAFLPWSLLVYVAVFQLIKNKNGGRDRFRNWILYGSALVTFLIFSFSGFQLPHYIAILFPQFSLITAEYLMSIKKEPSIKRIWVLQFALMLLAPILIALLSLYGHFGNPAVNIVITVILTGLSIYFFRNKSLSSVVGLGASLSIVLFVFLFNIFYPNLLQYQTGMHAGKWLKNKPEYQAAMYNTWSYTLEYYAPGYIERAVNPAQVDLLNKKYSHLAFYTSEQELKNLEAAGYKYQPLQQYGFFHISMLTPEFLDAKTRDKELEKMYLVTISK